MANLLYQTLQPGLDEDLFAAEGAAYAAAAAVGLNSADDSLPYSTSELNAPEYSTDEFRMFQFKVARCSKRYVHDWRACPFAHPTENARRRDPRLVKYLPVPCPDYKRGICLRGDSCTYSHGVYECWLHPAKYRTQLCKEGPSCRRPVCFFAHSVLDLRQPSHMFDAGSTSGGAEDMQASAAAALQQAAAAGGASGRPSIEAAAAAAAAFQRLSSEELLNNLQDGGAATAGGTGRPSVEVVPAAAAAMAAAAAAMQHQGSGSGASAAAMLAAAGSGGVSLSPNGSRQSSASLTRSSSSTRGGGSAPHSPDRSGSPTTPSQPSLQDLPAHRSAEPGAAAGASGGGAAAMSDAAAAMAVLTQQQQAQAAAAALAAARLSVDGGAVAAAAVRGASLDASSAAAAAAATTQAMLSGGGGPAGLPPRMSLDSLLASRASGGSSGWAPGLPPTATTAAAGLAGGASSLPLNEQPFPAGNAPRMSNAVARKLGLVPQRTSLDARLSKLRGGPVGPGAATPPRSSIDGILHALQQSSARSSLDQQQQAQAQAMLQAAAMSPQLAMAGLNGMGMAAAGQLPLNGGYGAYANPPTPNGYALPGTGPPDGMGLHPALLSLVAAQMGPPQQMHPGMAAMPPPGVPNGMHSGLGGQQGGGGGGPDMAALMESLNQWQLGGGAGGPGPATMGHRASMDGMTGMAGAPGMPGGAPTAAGAYFDGKGIWGGASSQEAINNRAGAD